MKILFLDVDGVLNTRPGSLDRDKLFLLAEIVLKTGCKIVLSSDWRLHPHMLLRIIDALRTYGIPFHGQTPLLSTQTLAWGFETRSPRHAEIGLWLAENNLKTGEQISYAIVDDDPGADDGSGRFVQTVMQHGLTKFHVEQLIGILNQ